MADNVAITAGSGTTVRTDDVGGTHYQYVKIDGGADGASAPIEAGQQDMDNSLPVAIASDQSAVPVSHAALTELAAAIDTEVQVDVVGALPAGTNAIGKLAANTGVDIGDVDVTSIVPGTGATNLGKAEDAAHSSGDVGVVAMTVRQNTAAALSGTDADYQPLITDTNGRLHTIAGNFPAAAVLANGGSVPTTAMIGSVGLRYNGSTLDFEYGNTEGTLLASAARTSTAASTTQTNYNARGVLLCWDTTVAGTGSLAIQLRYFDPVTGGTFAAVTSTSITTTGMRYFAIYPGAGAATTGTLGSYVANVSQPLPRTWRISVTHTDGSSWTYSLGYQYVL